jgi:putative DNA primase/helicase
VKKKTTSYPDEHCTDAGNARRIVEEFGSDIRYCAEWGKWLTWDGSRWALSTDAIAVRRIALEAARRFRRRAVDSSEKEYVKWATTSLSASRIRAALEMTCIDEKVAVASADLDCDQWILNVENGMIDLRTGDLLPHDRDKLCSKLAKVKYDPKATCPRWNLFLQEVMDGQSDLIQSLQHMAGYCLTGDTSEQSLYFFYGDGSNGKSTFLKVLQTILGDYAQPATRGLLDL